MLDQKKINQTDGTMSEHLTNHQSEIQRSQTETEVRHSKVTIWGIMTVVGGFLMMCWQSQPHIWGMINLYVLSYFYLMNPNVTASFIFLVDMILIAADTLGGILGAYLLNSRNWNPKILISLGGTFSVGCTFFSSFVKNLYWWLLLYGLGNGFGIGICYFVPLVCAWEYFPTRKGMMTGIIDGSHGLGELIFGVIATFIVNPTN